MADLRNFRSSYLEKVGIKGVEEKKSIEILLSEQPYDLEKLKQFCLRFPVPVRHRVELWKVLLDIVPPYQQIHDFVMQQRKQQYSDLRQAVFSLGRGTPSTPLSELHLRMFLIQEGMLPFNDNELASDVDSHAFIAMGEAIFEVVEDDSPEDVYWITHKFFLFQRKFHDERQIFVDRFEQYLSKEEEGGKLLAHLLALDALSALPLEQWMKSCYAGILPGNSFERVWDKVLGGSCKILLFVAIAMLLTFRLAVMRMKNPQEIENLLRSMDETSADSIVTKAIEMYHKHVTVS